MDYVNAACAGHVTIFSTGGKFRPGFKFYVVTRSYSSRPFLCILGADYRATSLPGPHPASIACIRMAQQRVVYRLYMLLSLTKLFLTRRHTWAGHEINNMLLLLALGWLNREWYTDYTCSFHSRFKLFLIRRHTWAGQEISNMLLLLALGWLNREWYTDYTCEIEGVTTPSAGWAWSY